MANPGGFGQRLPASMTAAERMADVLALGPAELVARYEIGVENFDRRVLTLPDDKLDTAFLPQAGVGRWPCRVLLGHLADTEILFIHRARMVIAVERPILAPWDEDAHNDSGLYGTPTTGAKHPVAGCVGVIHTLRRWSADWLKALTLEQWERTGLHAERGEQSVRQIMAYATWHLEHHAEILNRKVELLAR